jgi:DNA-binding MarR family transcriptional regulator
MKKPLTLQELITALTDLGRLPPLERATTAPMLIDATKGVLALERAMAFREAIEDDGMTQSEIARELGISRANVSDALKRLPPRKT